MKKLLLIALVILVSCNNVSLVENWKDPDTVIFHANKVLIVGMTQDADVREAFETKLVREFEKRNVESMRSLDVFDVSFTNTPHTERELDELEQRLLAKDFDAILFTKLIGSEDKKGFIRSYSEWDNYWSRFNEDYFEYQDVYSNPGTEHTFTVYHAQTTLYCICEGKERAMIWRGSVDITDPKSIENSVNAYIKLVVLALEEQDLIFYEELKEGQTDASRTVFRN
ncbi:hypothetical protein SAMN04490243_0166 [Robiginitalea myxolifaciens]|uniref:Cardiolipin synthetase n=1 Tax=Robiginitalea myxolifaciens TaxID=400055 RepID=A0A1I6FN16_9FLAO|nr:hypothetical protein [Robiginitalea myxolifaciens]SFR31339.1 hypothetical protein SAMN04490243_0166 [Robiginitalea myxolifaciens]